MFAKRLFDLLTSSVLIVLTSPLVAILALRIKFHDGGPVFYRGVRVGRHGKPFRIFKFRTMVLDADRVGPSSTAGDDPRITPIGRFIRRTKLDEIPQLFNVFVGEMSFVGPRPEVQRFTDLYTEEEKAILDLRPGITDWASIWNRDEGAVIAASGMDDADEAYALLIRPTKLRLQLKYARERTFCIDCRIVLRTVVAVLDRAHDTSDIAPPPGLPTALSKSKPGANP
jgi:lipopolysaccharide/colanic/teichoic acid biosynthesis glycosyltransferase